VILLSIKGASTTIPSKYYGEVVFLSQLFKPLEESVDRQKDTFGSRELNDMAELSWGNSVSVMQVEA
jgi:hypothetical protein